MRSEGGPSEPALRNDEAEPPCSVPVEPHDLPLRRFITEYKNAGLPVVVRNATRRSGASFRELTRLDRLSADFGAAEVTLSSANANSYGRRRASIAEYLRGMREIEWGERGAAADQLYYLFGEHGDELAPLLASYPLPRFAAADDECRARAAVEFGPRAGADSAAACPPPALSFGAAADGSGVPFHFHNDGFSVRRRAP